MVDAVVTPANVLEGSSDGAENATWGGTVTADMSVSKAATGRWIPALADGTANSGTGDAVMAGSNKLAVALNGGAVGQSGKVLSDRANTPFSPGFTATDGQTYVVSAANPGGIAPLSDLVGVDDDHVAIIGIGNSASKIDPIIG
jgi:hypothetical protein